MSLHFNDLFLGSALPFKNVRLQVCGPRSRGGYHTETEFLRRYAHQHFPLFALPSPRLSGRVYICVILSLRLGRREGGREGEWKKGGRKRKKEKKKKRRKRKEKKEKLRLDRFAQLNYHGGVKKSRSVGRVVFRAVSTTLV